MVTFRKKNLPIEDLMPKAIEYLREQGQENLDIIKPKDADRVSKINSKAMVLESFTKNANGFYEIQVRDKELYNYTQKLIKDIFHMRITNIDRSKRIVTAEVERYGIALDIIEVLSVKYNLSIVMP